MRLRKFFAAREGFTLTELLIVIAIIGVLTGVGLLAFNSFTAGAEDAVTEANARTCAAIDVLIEAQGLEEADKPAARDAAIGSGQTYAELCP